LRSAGRRRLREEQRRLDIRADQIVPARDGDFPDRRLKKRRRVVHQTVEPAECLNRLLNERRQFGDIEQVGLDQRDGIGALVIELGLQQSRLAGGRPVVQHQVRAGGVQPSANRGAHAFSSAGDQHHLAVHGAPLVHYPSACRIDLRI
jgi:hypothetical protein